MLSEREYAQLKDGKAMYVEVPARGANDMRLVQIIPIRGRHTGRIVRYSVTIPKHGRGTVAR